MVKKKVLTKVYDEQKAPLEAYGKQKAPVDVYNEQKTSEEVRNKEIAPEKAHAPENYEISMSYVHKGYKWDQNGIFINNILLSKWL